MPHHLTSTNTHFTDDSYSERLRKLTVLDLNQQQYMSEWERFKILDSLHPTSTGLDQVPVWFLRVGAPVFCQRISYLINLSWLLLLSQRNGSKLQFDLFLNLPHYSNFPIFGLFRSLLFLLESWNKQSSSFSLSNF